MKKPLLMLLTLCVSVLVVPSVSYASESISTRVKVVENKVRVHDKKIKDIKAQQDAMAKSLAESKAHEKAAVVPAVANVAPSAKPIAKEKTAEEVRHDRAVAAAQAKKRAVAEARAKHERLAALYRSRYAYP